MNALQKTVHLLDRLTALLALPGRAAAWLILPIIALSALTIACSLLHVHELLGWTTPVFLFGTGLNSTSLIELQWHLFAIMMLLAGSYTFAEDGHVRVDIIYSRLTPRVKLLINVLGDYLFLVPFCILVVRNSLGLVQFSWLTHEASSEMGLTHRWFIKSFVPIAMTLLGLQGLCRGTGGLLRLIGLGFGMTPDDFKAASGRIRHER